MSPHTDSERLRRAARRIGLTVGIASALVLLGGAGILVWLLLATGRPETRADVVSPDPGVTGSPSVPGGIRAYDHIVVDVDRTVPIVIALSLVGVAVLGLIAWYAARRATRPLAEAMRLQRHFVSDASHELRTPLTALTSRIQLVERRHRRGEEIDSTLSDLRRNAAAMDDVLTDLLVAAEADARDPSARAEVGEVIAATLDSLRPLADDREVTLAIDVAEAASVALPATSLTRMCVALVDNAIQHTPGRSTVTVSSRIVRDRVHIRVTDEGSGIRPEDRERIFERFARLGETGRRRGFGLGLSLVRDVAVRHGGSVVVEQTDAAGTTFLIDLPLAR